MKWVVDLFNMILSGFQYIVDFITKDVFEVFRQFGEFCYSFLEMCFYDVCYFCITLLQTIFDALFGSVDFSGNILSSWLSMNSEVRDALVFFRIPECIAILGTALAFRLILRLIPFL